LNETYVKNVHHIAIYECQDGLVCCCRRSISHFSFTLTIFLTCETSFIYIAAGDKNIWGEANNICWNIFHLPEHDWFSWQISRCKLL